MSKRKRNKKRAFPRRYASDYVNVTHRPRALFLDEETIELTDEHTSYDLTMQKLTKGELQDLNGGDFWFDQRGRIRSVSGPKNNMLPVQNNTFTNLERYECPMCHDKGTVTFVCKKCTVPGALVHPRAVKIIESRVPVTHRYSLIEKKYDETTGRTIIEVPRRTVEKLIRVLAGTKSGTEEWHYQTIGKTETWHLKLFFYASKYRWIEEDLTVMKAKRSCIYGSRARAMKAMMDRDIIWESLIDLSKED